MTWLDAALTELEALEGVTCWCGGEIGKREPGDDLGLGCLENIYHDYRDLT